MVQSPCLVDLPPGIGPTYRKAKAMPVFVIFVEGADTEPAKVPVYVVDSEEHASLLCEGMKETEYAIFDFSFKQSTRSDLGKFAIWANMICNARKGVYGNIVAGIHDMIDGAYFIMSGRRLSDKIASGADTETDNARNQAHDPPAPGAAKARKVEASKTRTKRDKLREQRLAFCRKRRAKGESWGDIYTAYLKEHHGDTTAGPDTLRLMFERYEGMYADK